MLPIKLIESKEFHILTEKNTDQRTYLEEKFFLKIITTLSFLFLLFISPAVGQSTTTQHADNNKDNALRGSGRINASNLGVEIDIPLGSYPGRGINVPVSISYSSKVWEITPLTVEPATNGSCFTVNEAVYGRNSKSGWTTSLAVPYITYTGWNNEFNTGGFAQSVDLCNQGSSVGSIIKRITVHMPSGETHELRVDDGIYNKSYNQSTNGTYYAADGSNIVYVENSGTNTYKLLMPDGSTYDFSNAANPNYTDRKAITFTDRNGNFTSYNETNDTWTDTLGRTLESPFKSTTVGVKTYQLSGMTGNYKFHWKKMQGATKTAADSGLTNPSAQLKYSGDLYDAGGNLLHRPANEALFTSLPNRDLEVSGGHEYFNEVVLTEIELPTGQSYKFTYDIYGRIERIYYPTGGEEHFTYDVIEPLTPANPHNVSDQANFGVTSRTLYESNGSSTSYTWDYSVEYVAPQGYKITIENPDDTKLERFLHRGKAPPNSPSNGTWGFGGYDEGLTGMPYEIRSFDNSGKIVSRNLTHYKINKNLVYANTTNDIDLDVYAHRNARVTHTESYVYDTANGNGVYTTAKFEYENESSLNTISTPLLKKKTLHYGYQTVTDGSSYSVGTSPVANPTPVPTPNPPAGKLIRTSEVTYLINDTSIPQATRDLYYKISNNKNMIGLTTASVVTDETGINVVSRSEMKYDESIYSPAVGRGNPTTSRVWDSTKGAYTNANAYIETHSKFDTYGNQIESTDALGRTTITEYDATDHAFPVKVTTPIPDASGTKGSNTEFVTEATFDFDSSTNTGPGLPLTTTDANGIETRITYDPVTLRPLNIKQYYQNNQIGSVTETIYDDANNKITNRSQIDANNWAESISYYDGLGRTYKTEQVHSDGNIFVEKELYADGKVKRVSTPYRLNNDSCYQNGEPQCWTTNIYDDVGRVVEVILPDGAKVKTDYAVSITGKIGTTKQITDQAGKKRKGINDALGRMIRVIEDPDGQALNTDYFFDTLGNLRETIQGEQHRYFMHDSLGRLLYSKQPEEDANTSFTATDQITNNTNWANKYVYDDSGNITSTTNAKGVTVTATYDNFNRITLRDYSDNTPDVSFYYDGRGLGTTPDFSKGKITKISNSVSETRYTEFDDLGRLLTHQQITQGNTYQTEYTYNLSGSILTEKYPSGRVMNYEYREDGELNKLSGTRAGNTAVKTYLNNISYDTLGNIEKMRLGNGTWESIEYNNRQQIKQIALGQYENDKSLLKIDYDYGTITQNNGSLRQQKINYNGLANEITQDYTYDDLNRLKSATEKITGNSNPSWKQTFNYDRYGNREFDANNTTTLIANNKVTNPDIEASTNRLKENQDNDTIADYTYDKAGNVTLNAVADRFIYDAENRIKEFFKGTNNGSTADATYEYDGDGKRVRKLSGETETLFVYNAIGELIAEYSNQMPETPKTSYLTQDHLGSPRIITDTGGAVVSRHDYLAFGDEVTKTVGNVAGRNPSHGYGKDDEIRKQYTGYERDKESGLDFAQARYYNSQQGRFTSVDPLTASANVKNPQTFNRYSYVLNSPYKFVDPLGLLAQESYGGVWQSCLQSQRGCETTGFGQSVESGESSNNKQKSNNNESKQKTVEEKTESQDDEFPVIDSELTPSNYKWGYCFGPCLITFVEYKEITKEINSYTKDVYNQIYTLDYIDILEDAVGGKISTTSGVNVGGDMSKEGNKISVGLSYSKTIEYYSKPGRREALLAKVQKRGETLIKRIQKHTILKVDVGIFLRMANEKIKASQNRQLESLREGMTPLKKKN